MLVYLLLWIFGFSPFLSVSAPSFFNFNQVFYFLHQQKYKKNIQMLIFLKQTWVYQVEII